MPRMKTIRTLGLAVTVAMPALTTRGQDAKAPPPPPVNPVSPGTSVDGAGAPVKLDPETLLAIRQIVQETVRQSQVGAPAPSPQASYQASPQSYQPPPVQQVQVVPATYAAPVTPVMVVQPKHWHKRMLGQLGTKMAALGQPTIASGTVATSVQTVQTVQLQQVGRTFSLPVSQNYQTAVQSIPVVQQVLQAPAAPHK